MKKPVGRIYVLSNDAMPGLLKIGYTFGTVENRVTELSSATGVPISFAIEFQAECRDPEGVEKRVHKTLSKHRYNTSREYFTVSVEVACQAIIDNADEIIDSESNFETRKLNWKKKEEKQLQLIKLREDFKDTKVWTEVPTRHWREFVDLTTYQRDEYEITIWQMSSYKDKIKYQDYLSRIDRVVYHLDVNAVQFLYSITFSEEMGIGNVLRESGPTEELYTIPENNPSRDTFEFVRRMTKINIS